LAEEDIDGDFSSKLSGPVQLQIIDAQSSCNQDEQKMHSKCVSLILIFSLHFWQGIDLYAMVLFHRLDLSNPFPVKYRYF